MDRVPTMAVWMTMLAFCIGCAVPELPETGSDRYRQTVTDFYTAVAAVQSGQDLGAEENLLNVTRLAPGEPAAWYNLGLLALRQNRFDLAGERLQRALELAPDNGDVMRLLGVMEITQGNLDAGLAHLRSAVSLRPDDARALYALAQELARSGNPSDAAEAASLLDTLAELLPENVVVFLERTRLAALRGDAQALTASFEALRAFSVDWPPATEEPLAGLISAVEANDMSQAQVQASFLRNLLLSTFAFRQNLREVQTPVEEVGELMTQFVRLASPSPEPSPPDLAVTFAARPAPVDVEMARRVFAASLDGGPASAVITAGPGDLSIDEEQISFDAPADGAFDVAMLDHNYDFLVDIVHVGAGGIRFFQQDSTGAFTIQDAGQMFGEAAGASYTGAWVADVDLEGDLDVLLASPGRPLLVMRNNGDATFSPLDLFAEATDVRDFAWADFDGDGDPDPALLDGRGELYLYTNERMGRYERRVIPSVSGNAVALAAADPDSDGRMDLAVLTEAGEVHTVSNRPGQGWTAGRLVQWTEKAGALAPGASLLLNDIDNNGALDIVVGSEGASRVWLNVAPAEYTALDDVDGYVQGAADLNDDGRLDLVGADGARPMIWENSGAMAYHWQVLRPRAGQALGDQRINSFTIGGEIEIRAGLLYQKQPISSPIVHFGLGDRERTDIARIIWPNGDIQSEFDLAADQSLFTPQRLKGSCPWLFTFDGERMRFVTDFIWRSPLGLRINAQETAGVVTTEDWVKISGDDLVARNGVYDVRITAELWETHFFDHVSLLAVDHPASTEVFVDERFAFPSPEMKVHHTSTIRPVASAITDRGVDVTEVIRHRDARYLDFFGRGEYQGITRDHFLDIDLGDALPDRSAALVAFGWVRPTDSSINVAISQGDHAPPQGIRLETPDGRGGWRVVYEDLGFPAGKTKTVLIDLEEAFVEDAPRKVRLYTNLEIYWDHIGWTTRTPESDLRIQPASLRSAELRYRGFSVVRAADRSSPELPDYGRLAGTMPRWRDLEGYYTRFGRVDELLGDVDDRYVIMNAGDELRFEFEALPPPTEGWKRDFVLVGDGWVKDGDYNTAFSQTVIPLPSHAAPDYDTPPTTLWEDPVYLQHKADWQSYHTRYVAGDRFQQLFITGRN